MNHLLKLAKSLHKHPSDQGTLIAFMDVLHKEFSIEKLNDLLSIDYEHITGHVLLRIADLLSKEDPDLYISIALWYYQFGCDEEASKYLKKAKQLQPYNQTTLRAEVYMNYGQPELPELVNNALKFYPNDPWLLSIKEKIERTGGIDLMKGPPVESRWETLIVPH